MRLLQLEDAKQAAAEELEATFSALMQTVGSNAEGRPMCEWKRNDKAVWIKLPPKVHPMSIF